MISSRLKAWTRRTMQRLVVPTFGRMGMTPNMLTLIGLLLTCGVAMVIAEGSLVVGGWLVLVAGVFDLFDGALARATDQQTRFGAFLDSTIDRYADAIIFGGLLLYFQQTPAPGERTLVTGLILAATVGSLLVSYTRARAEALGFGCEVGLLGRPERVIILAAGLITGWTIAALWVLAIFTNVTAVQRVIHIWQQERSLHQPLKLKPRKRVWLARPED